MFFHERPKWPCHTRCLMIHARSPRYTNDYAGYPPNIFKRLIRMKTVQHDYLRNLRLSFNLCYLQITWNISNSCLKLCKMVCIENTWNQIRVQVTLRYMQIVHTFLFHFRQSSIYLVIRYHYTAGRQEILKLLRTR